MKQKFFFDHIYKTAGSTIDRLFVDRLGMDRCTQGLVEPAISALTRYADKTYITGHFSFSPQDEFASERYNFTLLRHPVDRLISHYFFARNDVGPRGGDTAIELAKVLNLEDYYASNVSEVLGLSMNFQARHYAGLEWDGTETLDDEKILSLAKQALHHYDLVGVFDRLEEFAEVLFGDAGWGIPPELPIVNKTSNRPKLAEVSEKVKLKLIAMNRLDIELYDYANNMFDATRRKVLCRLAQKVSSFSNFTAASSTLAENCSAATPAFIPKPKEYGNRKVEITAVDLFGEISATSNIFTGEDVLVRIELMAHGAIDSLAVGIRIQDASGKIIFGVNTSSLGKSSTITQPGPFWVEYSFRNDLGIGKYNISIAVHSTHTLPEVIYHWKDAAAWFEVVGNIGYYFDGVFKLYPQVRIGSGVTDNGAQVVGTIEANGSPHSMHIGIHNQALNGLSARITPLKPPNLLQVGENIVLECDVVNEGLETWPHFGNRPVKISYHWKTPEGDDMEYDGRRTSLPSDLAAGHTLRLWVNLRAPIRPGLAVLHLAAVQEYVGWSKSDAPICVEIIR